MYERLDRSNTSALAYRISRPLSREEASKIAAELAGTIAAKGKVRVLIDLEAFPYADLGGLWEDLKFDVKHMRDLERLALVGGGKLETAAVRLFGTLTSTKSRCFGDDQLEKAWNWLIED